MISIKYLRVTINQIKSIVNFVRKTFGLECPYNIYKQVIMGLVKVHAYFKQLSIYIVSDHYSIVLTICASQDKHAHSV